MSIKRYNFFGILAEYSKKYTTNVLINSSVLAAELRHNPDNNIICVHYFEKGVITSTALRKNFMDFIAHFVSPVPNLSLLRELICNKGKKDLQLKIKIWLPNKIRYAYLGTNYFSSAGPLGKSCMRHKASQKSLAFYVRNNVKIVVIVDDKNKIHARALLWPEVKSRKKVTVKPFTYLDRVYANSDSIVPLFYDLAKEEGWRRYDGIQQGKAAKGLYIENLDIKGLCHMPWVDTFYHLYYKNNYASSDIVSTGGKYPNYVTLTHTADAVGGVYISEIDPNRVREEFTGNWVSKKDCIKVKRYLKEGHDGWVLKSNIADIKGNYYSKRDGKIIETKADGWILKVDSVKEVITGDIIDKGNAIESPKYKGFIHKSNAVSVKGEIYLKQDKDIICFKNKWYHISDCFINYDRAARNEELKSKQFLFWGENDVFVPATKNCSTRSGDLIPKQHATIAYNLFYTAVNGMEYQEVYFTGKIKCIGLATGEFIVDNSGNRQHLKKFNNKWYTKDHFEAPNKKQLLFSFMEKK